MKRTFLAIAAVMALGVSSSVMAAGFTTTTHPPTDNIALMGAETQAIVLTAAALDVPDPIIVDLASKETIVAPPTEEVAVNDEGARDTLNLNLASLADALTGGAPMIVVGAAAAGDALDFVLTSLATEGGPQAIVFGDGGTAI